MTELLDNYCQSDQQPRIHMVHTNVSIKPNLCCSVL